MRANSSALGNESFASLPNGDVSQMTSCPFMTQPDIWPLILPLLVRLMLKVMCFDIVGVSALSIDTSPCIESAPNRKG
jgi:hypothetical protein